MQESQSEQDQVFKLRDIVGLLQFSFQDLLQVMIDTIGKISRDAAIDPSMNVGYQLFEYKEIPSAAEEIVAKCLLIDALIDEAEENTLLSKEMPEIFKIIKDLSDTYEEKVRSLNEELEEAEVWMKKVNKVIDVVSKNTPWLSQVCEDNDDEEEEKSKEDEEEGKEGQKEEKKDSDDDDFE